MSKVPVEVCVKLPALTVMCGGTVSVPLLLKLAEVVSEPLVNESVSVLPVIATLWADAVVLIVMIAALAVLIVTAELDVGTPALQLPATSQNPEPLAVHMSAASIQRSSSGSKRSRRAVDGGRWCARPIRVGGHTADEHANPSWNRRLRFRHPKTLEYLAHKCFTTCFVLRR